MKKYFTILLITSLFVSQVISAQSSPQKMSYQAVIRDANNGLLLSTSVGMKISILQASSMGGTIPVYVETQTPTSNINGLVTLEIGAGTVISGIFSAIDWGNGPFYIKTETDSTGGSNYTITGTNQLLSVPFAFYAKKSENGVTPSQAAIIAATSGINTGDQDLSGIAINAAAITILQTEQTTQNSAIALNTAKVGLQSGTSPGQMLYWNGASWVFISPGSNGQTLTNCYGTPKWGTCTPPVVGDNFQGGIVFYILQSGDQGYVSGEVHGLIAAPSDQSTGTSWGCSSLSSQIPGADGTALGTGYQNTLDIVNGCATPGIAARICNDLELGGYNDWYLPSKDELNKLYLSKTLVGGFTNAFYWNSTEYSNNYSWYQRFDNGVAFPNDKNSNYRVRAIRSF